MLSQAAVDAIEQQLKEHLSIYRTGEKWLLLATL